MFERKFTKEMSDVLWDLNGHVILLFWFMIG